MRIPILITTASTGTGSTVLIDGKEITGVFSVEVAMRANEISTLTIQRYPRKGEETIGQLEVRPDSLTTETIIFKGRLAFEGELIAELRRPD